MGGFNTQTVLLSTLIMLTVGLITTAFIPTVVPGAAAGLGVVWAINLLAIGINNGGPWG